MLKKLKKDFLSFLNSILSNGCAATRDRRNAVQMSLEAIRFDDTKRTVNGFNKNAIGFADWFYWFFVVRNCTKSYWLDKYNH